MDATYKLYEEILVRLRKLLFKFEKKNVVDEIRDYKSITEINAKS